ncbi:hypothetical protein APA_1258 [Pseudanabaena sp. lw0831]|uniref:hypothetical protein n=1 Tax=Pseudanabaena sp. lw0831 TaxID=1357935 RepID=UPI0019162266|nr:hypothetical protein [Pseudanabaena sp. lw0831]GBO53351.1 hypothetical protein APA_1258 [Pseudanabaena sp. lw0831]
MKSDFEQLLRQIVQHELDEDLTDSPILEDIHTILTENGMERDENIPSWLINFFSALRNSESLGISPQTASQPPVYVGEFFSALQSILALDCYDYGEWVRVRLPKHGMLGFLSIEHAYYQVARLTEIPEDGLSDISAAKMLNRSS